MQDDEKVTYFAETDSRNKQIRFGIKAKDLVRNDALRHEIEHRALLKYAAIQRDVQALKEAMLHGLSHIRAQIV